MLKILSLSITTLFLSVIATAAPSDVKVPLTNLKAEAEKILVVTPDKNAPQFTTGLTAEQADGLLKLEDPFEDLSRREFLWTFGLSFRNYKPEGRADLATGAEYDISDAGSTILPAISLGSLYNLSEGTSGGWQIGFEAELAYIQQKITARSQSLPPVDGRLNTALIEGHLLTRWGPTLSSPWHLILGYGLGQGTMTQASSSSVGQWSKSGSFQSLLAGADYQVSKKVLVGIQSRTLSVLKGSAGFSLPKNHLEGGVKVLW